MRRGRRMSDDKPISNQMVVLREEFDDWAVLFDPDTAEGYTLNPVGVFIWKRLDGLHTLSEIALELKKNCEDSPEIEKVEQDCKEFIENLVKQGLAGYEIKKLE